MPAPGVTCCCCTVGIAFEGNSTDNKTLSRVHSGGGRVVAGDGSTWAGFRTLLDVAVESTRDVLVSFAPSSIILASNVAARGEAS